MTFDSSLAPTSSSALTDLSLPVGEQFLRFQLGRDTAALLPISQLTEVLTIPIGQITPVPQLPGWVMGVYNWRGEVLWMVDLAHLSGLIPWHQQAINVLTYTAIVLSVRTGTATHADDQMVGLVVNRAETIEWCDPNALQPLSPDVANLQLMTFLRGYQFKSNGKRLAVFDDEVIVEAISRSKLQPS
ncbi:MAG: purine-binding chemotaxis protein CheW [Cyanobacteria bacterium CRU_2_1]|nr:purine-binding chemotaxis protein CheW [Cyanobacteria bacterium RU_5_0]NJR62096.1 purine-binding chemotaxis protein CheW [Cyanobacteria bacterium CRU_2_1]